MPPPPRHRGRSNGHGGSRKAPPPPAVVLPGPLRNRDQILQEFGQNIQLKPQWEENPKAPLANYLGGGTGGAQNLGGGGSGFQTEEGVVDGVKVFR